MHVGIGLEFARAQNIGFEQAARRSAQAGYRYIEPYVYSPALRELNSHLTLETRSNYHHLNTASLDLGETRSVMKSLGLKFSAFDAHSTLLMPQIGVPFIASAIDLAAELDCPIVMSDEGPVPHEWLDLDRAFDVMCLSIEHIVKHAQAKNVLFAIELHNALTTQPSYLAKLLRRFGPDELGVNFDTGNSFLAGNDPVEMLRSLIDRVIHVHIKDIPASELPMRGTVTGTRVGVGAGEGVVELREIIRVLTGADYSGVVSVECDTWEQAQRSRPFLDSLIHELKHTDGVQMSPPPTSKFSAALRSRSEAKTADS
jgi:sugar phosphate isomerase/epimerase